MKRGFTLIELLAVIVILAIIALIATPIVLNIINETKESATLRSAEFYMDAVENKIAMEMLKGETLDGPYNITKDGDLCKETLTAEKTCPDNKAIKIEVSGEKPSGGSIKIENGNISNLSLNLNDKTIVQNEKGELVYQTSICTLVKNNGEEGITPGDEYSCKVDPNKEAYTFYVLSEGQNGTTNLILDRNVYYDETTGERGLTDSEHDGLVAWINQEDYEKVSDGSYSWEDWIDIHSYGPITAMNYLEKATSSWTNLQKMTISTFGDETGAIHNMGKTYNVYARLPYKSEVDAVGCDGYEALSCPVWMVDYLCDLEGEDYQQNPLNNIRGYWTFSTYDDGEVYSDPAWNVDYYGYVDTYSVDNDDYYGVRPVINLKL